MPPCLSPHLHDTVCSSTTTHPGNLSNGDLKVIGSMAEEIVRKMTAEDRASSHRRTWVHTWLQHSQQ